MVMNMKYRTLFSRIIKYSLCSLLILTTGLAWSNETLDQQRELYRQAQKSLASGQISNYRQLSARLVDYPLYPYLIYNYLRPRLTSASEKEIISYLQQYDDVPVARDLRRQWLKHLARQGKWETYLANYEDLGDSVLQCYQLTGRIKTGRQDYLLEDIRSMWLAGKSQPDECDPAFALLYESELMGSELVWERIRLSMENRQTRLAKYLARRLDTSGQKLLDNWIMSYGNPARGTALDYEDQPISREILTQGMKRLATVDIDTAISRWPALKEQYSFNIEQIDSIERTIAVRAVIADHAQARGLLDTIENGNANGDIFHWRLRNALKNHDWQSLARWTEGNIPEDNSIGLRWRYWRARALEMTGQPQEASRLYQGLAEERDYYGFLAADRLQLDYNLGHHSLPEDLETWNEISDRGAVKRARELYLLGNRYHARREWNQAISNMGSYQLQVAAMVAANWGWHDRTILTLGKAEAYDDLILRFPIVYRDEMTRYTTMRQLDLGWVYALTRAESAFMSDARSPSGALGLMQLMPATGRETARQINFRTFNNSYLLEPEKNITIGTAYLKKVYDRFDNVILATAAYNAGPNAVARWLPDEGCVEPDIWVESIPYTETRKYVARIMFYATLYDWRLNNQVTRINQRMANITPEQQALVAGLSCPVSTNISGL